jgi:uncharacterized membrane protein YuzA (DUF378 family)
LIQNDYNRAYVFGGAMFAGLIIGAIAFVLIGLFHPLVIKCEYHFGVKVWTLFFIAGVVFGALSLLFENILLSSSCALTGFCCVWSIRELFEQKKRVQRGWFPKKKSHKDDTNACD